MSDYWLETVRVSVFVGGGGSALSASHKWVGVLQKTQQDSATNTTLTTINLDSGSSAVWRDFEVTLDVLLNNGTIHDSMQFVWTKTGTPGTLTTALTLVYRLVET